MNHFNIGPSFVESFYEQGNFYLIYKYIKGISLFDYIATKNIFTKNFHSFELEKQYINNILKIFIKIMKQLSTLFQNNLRYGDLNPKNIIISKNKIFLIDFETLGSNKNKKDFLGTKGFYSKNIKSDLDKIKFLLFYSFFPIFSDAISKKNNWEIIRNFLNSNILYKNYNMSHLFDELLKLNSWNECILFLQKYKNKWICDFDSKKINSLFPLCKLNKFIDFKNITLFIDLSMNEIYKKLKHCLNIGQKEQFYNLLVFEVNKLKEKNKFYIENGACLLGLFCLKGYIHFSSYEFMILSRIIVEFLKSKIITLSSNIFVCSHDIYLGLFNGQLSIALFFINHYSLSKNHEILDIAKKIIDFVIKKSKGNDGGMPSGIKSNNIIYSYFSNGSAGLAFVLLKYLEIKSNFIYEKKLIEIYEKLKIRNYTYFNFEHGALGILFVISRIEKFLKIKSEYIKTIINAYFVFLNSKEKKIANLILDEKQIIKIDLFDLEGK